MSESKDSVVFGVRLSRSEKDAWQSFCERELNGVSPPKAARSLMLQMMTNQESKSVFSPGIMNIQKRTNDPKDRATKIYLSESEHLAIEALAKQSEMSVSSWISYAARAAVRVEGEPTPKELKILIESNKYLNNLSNYLNQIARKLNQNYKALEPEALAMDELKQSIDGHTKRVSGYIKSCANRWELKE